MPLEIERKFLVDASKLDNAMLVKACANSVNVTQGYISIKPAVRVRLVGQHDLTSASLTVKGKGTVTRPEFEYKIPVADAYDMLSLAKDRVIYKTRYYVEASDGHVWELDHFAGHLDGLWLAELELTSENQSFVKPAWVGREVTELKQFSNAWLAENVKSAEAFENLLNSAA